MPNFYPSISSFTTDEELGRHVATWPKNSVRWFAIDYDNGNDDNLGYSDISLSDAGTKAVKTLEHFETIFPKIGNGRRATVAIRTRTGGATYRNKADTADDDLDFLAGIQGYAHLIVRGTATDTTAGCTAFDNTTADKRFLGFVQVSGTESAGYRISGTPSSSSFDCVKVSDGSPANLSAEPALLGYRVRFDANTPTAGLRNMSEMIWQNTGQNITVGNNFPATPVAGGAGVGDVFYIERPGVVFNHLQVNSSGFDGRVGQVPTIVQLVLLGLRINGRLNISGAGSFMTLSGIESTTSTLSSFLRWVGPSINITKFWRDEDLALFNEIGFGIRTLLAPNFQVPGATFLSITNSAFLKTQTSLSLSGIRAFDIGGGCYFAGSVNITGCGAANIPTNRTGTVGGLNPVDFGNAGTTTERRARINATTNNGYGVTTNQSNVALYGVDITNCGAKAAVQIAGFDTSVSLDDVVGSVGNTDVGIDCSLAKKANILFGHSVVNTITGTAGNIKTSSGTVTHVEVSQSDKIDSNGNHLVGTSGEKNTKTTANVLANVPILGANPAAPINGDVWIVSSGSLLALCAQIDGVTRSGVLL